MPRKNRRPIQVSIEMILKHHKLLDEFNKEKIGFYVKFKNPPYQPLTIEQIYQGHVSISHTYIQNGDVMRDPEIVLNKDNWYGFEITQDPLGRFQSIPEGKYSKGIERLLRTWAMNLRYQGWVTDAEIITIKRGDK